MERRHCVVDVGAGALEHPVVEQVTALDQKLLENPDTMDQVERLGGMLEVEVAELLVEVRRLHRVDADRVDSCVGDHR